VISWFIQHGRAFPWRDTDNAFHVFIAEVLLRQTQADRLVAPYLELLARYPNVETLASANVDELRHWFKPLGLVKRADRLVEASRLIAEHHGGSVPHKLNTLLSLPGLGIYSAQAILCLAFNERVTMIDESSGRLLRRFLGTVSHRPAYSDKQLLKVASSLLPGQSYREFNLGLLDLAAKFCHARTPACGSCPLLQLCNFGTATVGEA